MGSYIPPAELICRRIAVEIGEQEAMQLRRDLSSLVSSQEIDGTPEACGQYALDYASQLGMGTETDTTAKIPLPTPDSEDSQRHRFEAMYAK